MSQRSRDLLTAANASKGGALFLWRQAMRSGRERLLIALACNIAAGIAGLVFALAIARAASLLMSGSPPAHNLLIGAACALALRALLSYGSEQLCQQIAAETRVALRHRLFDRLLENGPILARREQTGDIAATLMEKVEACDGYIARYLPQLAMALVLPPLIIVLVDHFSPFSALILLACGLLLPVFLAFSGVAAGKASRKQLQALARLGSLFYDRLKHMTTLRVFGAAGREGRNLQQSADDFRTRTMNVLRLAFLSASALDLFFMLALMVVALHLNSAGLPLGDQMFVVLLVNEFFAPLRALSASYHDRAAALAAVHDINTLLEQRHPATGGNRPAPSPLRQPSIELRGISFTYPGRSAPALDNVTLRAEGSEFLAISGASGAGKSTLLHLLLGFITPQEGLIFLAGQPLHLINPTERTAAFALVGQRSHIFHGTLADNIRLGRPEAQITEIMKAAEAAQLGDFIRSLPQGLETIVGERGFGLSGGQAQRVALARAFLRDAPVLLLDEPTAGLDQATATLLMLTIRKLAEGRTVLMVSHDPIALNAAERVVKLEAAHV